MCLDTTSVWKHAWQKLRRPFGKKVFLLVSIMEITGGANFSCKNMQSRTPNPALQWTAFGGR